MQADTVGLNLDSHNINILWFPSAHIFMGNAAVRIQLTGKSNLCKIHNNVLFTNRLF